jgi:hypothetical protein
MLMNYRFRYGSIVVLCSWLIAIASAADRKAAADDVDDTVAAQIAVIAKVGPQGTGSAAARQARDQLAKRDVEILPQLLAAMNTSNVVAANWYRTIYEEIVDRGLAHQETVWPIAFLKKYVSNGRNAHRPRALVLALLDRLEPEYREQWLLTRLDDPDFHGDAVARVLAAGEQALREGDHQRAKTEFRQAFDHALDSSQVTRAAHRLQALGESADVFAHLGLVTSWWLAGPFDAPEKTGFATTFEPESKVDLGATYQGQGGKKIGWIKYESTDPLGQVDLNKALGPTREAVGYAYAEIDASREQTAHLRCGADDNCSVWLNGRKVFAREQWLNGTRFDRFITPVTLVAGRNTLLVKVCQGPQHKDPEVPNNWSLQLRLCDEYGRGVPFKTVVPE